MTILGRSRAFQPRLPGPIVAPGGPVPFPRVLPIIITLESVQVGYWAGAGRRKALKPILPPNTLFIPPVNNHKAYIVSQAIQRSRYPTKQVVLFSPHIVSGEVIPKPDETGPVAILGYELNYLGNIQLGAVDNYVGVQLPPKPLRPSLIVTRQAITRMYIGRLPFRPQLPDGTSPTHQLIIWPGPHPTYIFQALRRPYIGRQSHIILPKLNTSPPPPPPKLDIEITLEDPEDRWFTYTTKDRWIVGDTDDRWEAYETIDRWTIPSYGAKTMTQLLSTASLEYVRVPVAVTKSGAFYDPSVDVVQMAFTLLPTAPVTFYTGAWEVAGTSFFALCLVGPGGTVTLTPATYYVWVKITDNPEVPVLMAGTITVQ